MSLSEKMVEGQEPAFFYKDVKEHVKMLKEEFKTKPDRLFSKLEIDEEIDKIFGEKLTK